MGHSLPRLPDPSRSRRCFMDSTALRPISSLGLPASRIPHGRDSLDAMAHTSVAPAPLQMLCYCESAWHAVVNCRLADAQDMRLPFVCPADYHFELRELGKPSNMSGVAALALREHSFLENAATSAAIKVSPPSQEYLLLMWCLNTLQSSIISCGHPCYTRPSSLLHLSCPALETPAVPLDPATLSDAFQLPSPCCRIRYSRCSSLHRSQLRRAPPASRAGRGVAASPSAPPCMAATPCSWRRT